MEGNPIICSAKFYIGDHLDRIVSLEETASYCHVSPGYLSRLFMKETGEGFAAYTARLKMEKAKSLLEENNDTVSEIGYALGFNEAGYFIKIFKKHVGMTPGKYKKAYKQAVSS